MLPSMPPQSFIERLRQSRIVQALGVYLGTSWAIVGFVDLIQERLALPEALFTATLVLLAFGFLVVLATAWVQSLPSTTAREEAGELPSDWELAPGAALADIRAGHLPHLTWARAAVAGALAFAVVLGGTFAFSLVTGRGLPFGPSEAGADVPSSALAVLPFSTRGPDLDVWREGMVDVLAAGLDGVGGIRTIDSRTTLARWNEANRREGERDLRSALEAGGRTGARYVLLGSAVQMGASVRLSAEIYDLVDGSVAGRGASEGPADSLLVLVDRLGAAVTTDFLGASGAGTLTRQRIASVTTGSLPALRSYLDGEALFRRGDLEGAIRSMESAVEADSTFALALFRLYQAMGWVATADADVTQELGERLRRHLHRLPPRDRAILTQDLALGASTLWEEEDVEVLVELYPDDPEAWNTLGEAHFHAMGPMQGGFARAEVAFRKALELSPGFLPYAYHLLELALARGDAEEADALLELVAIQSADDDPRLRGYSFARWALAGPTDVAIAADSLRALEEAEWSPLTQFQDLPPLPSVLNRLWHLTVAPDSMLEDADYHEFAFDLALATGRRSQALRHAEAFRASGVLPVTPLHFLLAEIVGGVAAEELDAALRADVCGSTGHLDVFCTTAVAIHDLDRGRITRVRSQARADREMAGDLAAAAETPSDRAHAREHLGAALALEGLASWSDGDRAGALAKLDSATRTNRFGAAVWRQSTLLEEEGYLDAAVSALRTLDDVPLWVPFAHLRIGELLERSGRDAEAAHYLRSAASAWVEADPGFLPALRARAALERLGVTPADEGNGTPPPS